MIPNDNRTVAAACATIETTKEDGLWFGSGRSEKSEMVREELIFGSLPSHAPAKFHKHRAVRINAQNYALAMLPKLILTSFCSVLALI
jgi:hypothetical protein